MKKPANHNITTKYLLEQKQNKRRTPSHPLKSILIICMAILTFTQAISVQKNIHMAQACSKDVETLADNLLTISTPESHAYLENVQERDPQLASEIVDIIGEDEDDDGISPES
jgi:hypothetical protein